MDVDGVAGVVGGPEIAAAPGELREVAADTRLRLRTYTDEGGGRVSDVDDERFHLILTAGGKPVMHGWWSKKPTAVLHTVRVSATALSMSAFIEASEGHPSMTQV